MAKRFKRKTRERVRRKLNPREQMRKSAELAKKHNQAKAELAGSLTSFVQYEDKEMPREQFLRNVADRINMDLGRQVSYRDKSIKLFEVVGRVAFPMDMLRFDQCWPADVIDAAKINVGKGQLRVIKLYSHKDPTAHKWSSYLWNIAEKPTTMENKQIEKKLKDKED